LIFARYSVPVVAQTNRLVHPLSGSTEWVEFDGTTAGRRVWDGRAELEEFNVDSPEKHIRIQGFALRLYNPQSHQWSIYWANAAKGPSTCRPWSGSSVAIEANSITRTSLRAK
jgi:hypothetical protein